ncbi:uncharacterized protein VP01_2201g1 [Puccinia sorghi]|uniref:DNA-directed RNA polymerase III subunit RPC4 n=1 Tax=Puccinia sorghi TaxID=27349 RepID=A0A0L6V956_9BASI|nr:uncharacterized protein VP01_2201g1 [Puccinia sorghi]
MPPRGTRGRGRGRAREPAEDMQTEAILDPLLSQMTDISVHGGPAGASAVASTSIGKTIPATGEPGAPKAAASKFKPRMVKRVAKTEPDVDANEAGQASGTRGGRGRGRGGADRGGRGRAEIVMTASGAFAMGPAEASVRRTVQGPSRSGMRKIDNSVMPSDGRPKGGDRGTAGGMLEIYSDMDEEGSDGNKDDLLIDDDHRAKVADLNDITLEHSMAPFSLPWDPKRIADREKLILARNEKMAKLAQAKVKKEAIDSKPVSTTSLLSRESTINNASSSSTPNPSLPTKVEHLDDKNENIQRDVKLKKEQLEEISNVGKEFTHRKKPMKAATHVGSEGVSTTPSEIGSEETGMYVFQFPRVFPYFEDPIVRAKSGGEEGKAGEQKPGLGPMVGGKVVKKKKKPGLDDWLGWGKGGRRTECMGVPPGTPEDAPPLQGQIGELVIRRSGRVQMIIADVAYDVLPGAQPTFHQEIAVIDPSPSSNLRALFVLGSAHHKFIVVPDVSSLLKREQALKSSPQNASEAP